jgi:hypothetical protein
MIFPNLVLSQDPTLSATVEDIDFLSEESEELEIPASDEDASIDNHSAALNEKELKKLRSIK